MKVKSESEVAQSYPTLSDSMDCSLPGSSIHGIFQARVLEWGAIAFSNLYAEYIIWNAEMDEAQDGIKIAGRNSNILRYADDTTLMAESEEVKGLLMKMKEESEKAGLKLNIQKTKIMASSPISSWQIDGETMEMVRDFYFFGSKITADGDCSHEIKDACFLEEKLWPT